MINQIEKNGDKSLSPIQMGEEVMKLSLLKKRIDERLQVLRDELLNEIRRLDVFTLKTGKYLISRRSRKSVKVIDKKRLEEDLKKWDVEMVYSIDLDYMRPVINNLIKEGNELEGVEVQDTEYLSITINQKKGKENEKEISGRDKGEGSR